MEIKDIVNFIYEMAQLRRIRHEGFRMAGVDQPESVADHSLRAAQIGYVLAKMEKFENPELVCTMLVFHDMGEARIGDIHKVASRYVDANERKAVEEQTSKLEFAADLMDMWSKVEDRKEFAGILAKDADYLEQAFMAKEYLERGYSAAQNWLDNVRVALKTNAAKELFMALLEVNSFDWWEGLKKLEL